MPEGPPDDPRAERVSLSMLPAFRAFPPKIDLVYHEQGAKIGDEL